MSRLFATFAALLLTFTLFVAAHAQTPAQEDLTPPVLLEVTFDPPMIDTTKGPVTVTVTIHITDDLSGMALAALFFDRPETTQHAQVEFRPDQGWSKIISGDIRDGYQQAAFTVPQYAAYGEWEMGSVVLEDKVGNRAEYTRPEDKDEAGRGNDGWPSIYNGFSFQVGQAQAPQQAQHLFFPMLAH